MTLMDPLSITAGVLAVLAAARASVRCLRKVINTQSAPDELAKVLREVNDLCTLLESILDYVGSFRDAKRIQQASVLTEHIYRASTVIDNLALCTNASFLRRLNLSDRNAKRAAWLQHKTKIMTISNDLKVVRLDICLALQILAS